MKKENIVIYSLITLSFLLFLGMCILIKLDRLPVIDTAWRDFCYQIRGEKGGFIYWLMRSITEFGYIYIMAIVIIGLGIYTGFDNRFFILLLIILLSRVFNTAFKELYERARPLEDMRWQVETSTSFPSGHSTNVAVIFGYLAYLFYKDKHKKSLRITGMAVSIAIIPLVMLSRNILGVHYLTDVIAGASCGLFCAGIGMLLLIIFNKNNVLVNPLVKFKWLKEEENEEAM